jgi:hypothetical protein
MQVKATEPQPSPNIPSGAAPAATVPNLTGRWQTIINDGRRSWTCISENFSNGDYRFSAGCPPPFTNERGRGELTADGTWKLEATSGRTDSGTYRVISPNQIEMTGRLGTAVWSRVQTPSRQVPQAQGVTAPRVSREPLRAQPLANPAQEDWQRQDAQRRALLEEQRRQRQEALERQRQVQLEQQQQRQREYQERQAQRQQDQILQEGAKVIQRLFHR